MHVSATFDSEAAKVYLDGQWAKTVTGVTQTVSSPSANLSMGLIPLMPWFKFLGHLDDVRLYNRALEQGEIESIVGTP